MHPHGDVLSRRSSLSLPKGLHLKPPSPGTDAGDQKEVGVLFAPLAVYPTTFPKGWTIKSATPNWRDKLRHLGNIKHVSSGVCLSPPESITEALVILWLFFPVTNDTGPLDACVEPAAIAISPRQGRWHRLDLARWNVCGSLWPRSTSQDESNWYDNEYEAEYLSCFHSTFLLRRCCHLLCTTKMEIRSTLNRNTVDMEYALFHTRQI